MIVAWILFGLLAVLNVPMLALWLILGIFTVIVGFLQLSPSATSSATSTAAAELQSSQSSSKAHAE
jgi:hypothetical protein